MRAKHLGSCLALVAVAALALAIPGQDKPKGDAVPQKALDSISTPEKDETRIGTLEFKDGAPSKATVDRAYDHIDFTHAYNAFANTMQGVSLVAARRGFLEAGVKDNEVLIFSELMDAKSLFLTANADTVYFLGFIDVS